MAKAGWKVAKEIQLRKNKALFLEKRWLVIKEVIIIERGWFFRFYLYVKDVKLQLFSNFKYKVIYVCG